MLIGITGKAGSGKDTAGEILAEHLSYPTYAFAWPLKRYCMIKFGLSWSDVNTQEGKARYIPWLGCTVRDILQKEGTEHTKPFWGENFWVKRMEQILGDNRDVGIITDVRFDLEAQWVIDNGGVIVEIQRDTTKKVNDHASESGINPDLVTYFVENKGSIADLRIKLEGLFSEHRD